jgi:hypothetical protein
LKDLQVFRNGTRIGVNLEQNAAKDMGLLLLPGDSLFMSRNDPYVEIVGAVYNPQLIRFESSSFKSYISAAGGLKNRGSLSKAYIQYSNGINRKTTKFLFFKFYPTVKSGSKIIVPDVPEKQNLDDLIKEIFGEDDVTALISADKTSNFPNDVSMDKVSTLESSYFDFGANK